MHEKCRLCGENSEELFNIFEENHYLPYLKLRININLQISISPSDRFSHSICEFCFKKLGDLDKFIKNCQQTQFILSNIHDSVDSEMEEPDTLLVTDEYIPVFIESAAPKNSLFSNMECDGPKTCGIEISPKKKKASDSLDVNFSSNEEIEINLDDYVTHIDLDENLNDSQEIVSVVSRKIPYSKLASFFSSKIQLNKSVTKVESGNDELLYRNIENVCHKAVNDDLKKVDVIRIEKIEKKEVKFENNSKEAEVFKNNSEEESCASDVKCEKADLMRTNIKKYKSNTRSSKMKIPNMISCPICTHQFALNEIEDHIKFHSDDEEYLKLIISEMKEVPFKQKMHYCEECKKVFVRDSLYMEHLKEHSKIRMINCHLCDHTFSLRKKLKVHLRAVHIPKNSKCDQCSYAAKTPTDLQKHKKGVHEYHPIICEICGKSVSSNVSNYNRHLQTHSEERPYRCELCEACYKTAASLQKHRDNIHFPKSVMCTACGTICGSKIKYKKHVRRCRRRMLRYN